MRVKEKNMGVIVLGGHVQGLGIMRTFGKQKIPSILIDNTSINIGRHSKYCNKFFKVKDDALLEFLLNSKSLNDYNNWIIFPTNDLHVKLLSQNIQLLENKFNVATDNWDIIKIFYNKINTYKLLLETNINLPKTFFPKNLEDLNNCTISFPLIIKPAVMHEFYKQLKTKVFVCNDKSELLKNYSLANEIISTSDIMIQEIIPGSYKSQYSACFFSIKGKPVVTMLGKRCRQHPLTFGNATTYAETINNHPEFYNDALEILNKTKYTGLCEIEFIYDERDNKFKFLEVNPRTWKWHSIAEKAETPFLISIYNFLNNISYPTKNVWRKASFRHRTTDIPTCFKILLKKEKVKTDKSNIVYAVWDNQDIIPSLFEILYLPILILKR